MQERRGSPPRRLPRPVRMQPPRPPPPPHLLANPHLQSPPSPLPQPNFIYTHHAVSNDDYWTSGSLWGMGGGYGARAAAAWAADVTGSRDVIIGVIDEGIMLTHPDLQPNVGANPGEIPGV